MISYPSCSPYIYAVMLATPVIPPDIPRLGAYFQHASQRDKAVLVIDEWCRAYKAWNVQQRALAIKDTPKATNNYWRTTVSYLLLFYNSHGVISNSRTVNGNPKKITR